MLTVVERSFRREGPLAILANYRAADGFTVIDNGYHVARFTAASQRWRGIVSRAAVVHGALLCTHVITDILNTRVVWRRDINSDIEGGCGLTLAVCRRGGGRRQAVRPFAQRNARRKAPAAVFGCHRAANQLTVIVNFHQRVAGSGAFQGRRGVIRRLTGREITGNAARIVIHLSDSNHHFGGVYGEVNGVSFRPFVTGLIHRLNGKAVVAIRQRLIRREAPVTVFIGYRAPQLFTVIAHDYRRVRLGFTFKGWRRVIGDVAAVNRTLHQANVVNQLITFAGFWRGGIDINWIRPGFRTDITGRVSGGSSDVAHTIRQIAVRRK